ncbi:MAG TPA: hypothetical protein VHX86_09210 [Tepidisphaeraceae bacterium]|jgi:hypothetical protein|nr:hypothetical protein [Tepidisphaeraceae bacterium]
MDLKVQTKPDDSKPARPRPSALNYYASALASEWRRFRTGLTRENVMGFLKKMAWTIALTVLIWVYAESEEVVPALDQPIAIEVKSRDPSKIVTADPNEKVITCDLRGPQSNLDQFIETLQPNSPITVDLDTSGLPDGNNKILTLENLKENSRFKEAGITIEKCTPPTLTIFVDSRETKKVLVASPPNIAGLKSATFNPATVNVTGASHLVKHLSQVTADISTLPILNQPGPHPPEKVPLVRDPSGNLTYSPAEVEATLTVAEKDVTYTCTNVPVWIEIQPTIAETYSVSFVNNGGFVPKLEVIGPPEQIDRLRSPRIDVHPRAVLEIGPDNVNDTNPVPLTIENLPDGVRVKGANPEISFTATRRG